MNPTTEFGNEDRLWQRRETLATNTGTGLIHQSVMLDTFHKSFDAQRLQAH